MGKKLLFASVLLCFLSVAHANKVDIRTTEQAVAFGNQLMMDISRGKIQQAWRNVKANSTIPPDRVDAFATDYDKHLNQTIQFLGQPLGVEMVATEAFGRSIMRITYLVKYNLSGVAWYMYFYKMNDQWVLSEFNFDLNSNSVFAKINQAKIHIGEIGKALDMYEKATKATDNESVVPMYLKKLGMLNEKQGNKDAALAAYQRIQSEFPNQASGDWRDIEKYIYRLKGN